jgi:hypothetical protein
VFQDGSVQAIMPASEARLRELVKAPTTSGRAEFLNPDRRMRQGAITHPRMPRSPGLSPTVKIDADPSTGK